MPSDLTLFLSSTVEDLGDVRESIARRLRRRGHVVRLSEEPDFPVEPGVTSHDACLSAVRQSNVLVLLIGQRFGGEYRDQNKSITWREWEEARSAGLLTFVLIHKDMNELARKIYLRRRALAELPAKEREATLRAEFPDQRPLVHRLPDVQRFIDVLRKGHIDNWIHATWRGTADDALHIIDRRLGASLVAFQGRQNEVRDVARRRLRNVDSINYVVGVGTTLMSRLRAGLGNADEAVEALMSAAAQRRAGLFDFHEDELYNLMLYRRRGDELVAGPRVCHEAVVRRGRTWRVDEGHVGAAVKSNSILVTGDLRQTEAWAPREETAAEDARQYVSAITVPLYLSGAPDRPDGAFIVTSNRVDHFRDLDQAEVLTAQILGRMISCIWSVGVT